jgi:hypothetical protein
MVERSNKIDIEDDEDAAETALLAAAVAVARKTAPNTVSPFFVSLGLVPRAERSVPRP